MAECIPGRDGVDHPGKYHRLHARGSNKYHTSSVEPTHMYEQLCSWENILLAYKKAAKGKRGRPNVAAFEYSLEDHLLALQHELFTQSYQPGGYHNFYIHEPKKRLISAASFRDRVVHHALCNVIEPIFDRGFSPACYANRKKMGTHRALNRAQHCAQRYRYVFQCDIRQFFPAIDHDILLTALKKKISDDRVLQLCAQILESGSGVLVEEYEMVYYPGDDLLAAVRPRGLPIGNLTSQFWANVYLSGFDHFIQRKLGCCAYVRYVDDFLLFGDEKKLLWQWKKAVEAYLTGLRLTIHSGAHPRPVSEGFPFLGFVVFPDRRRVKRRKVIHFRRKLRRLAAAYQTGEMPLAQLNACVQGWVNHVRYGNTIGLRKAVLSGVFKRQPGNEGVTD